MGRFTNLGVDACVQGIVRSPEGHKTVYANYRRALVRRFPYAVFYEYGDGAVTVYRRLSHVAKPENGAALS